MTSLSLYKSSQKYICHEKSNTWFVCFILFFFVFLWIIKVCLLFYQFPFQSIYFDDKTQTTFLLWQPDRLINSWSINSVAVSIRFKWTFNFSLPLKISKNLPFRIVQDSFLFLFLWGWFVQLLHFLKCFQTSFEYSLSCFRRQWSFINHLEVTFSALILVLRILLLLLRPLSTKVWSLLRVGKDSIIKDPSFYMDISNVPK